MGEYYSRLPIIGASAHDDPVSGAPLLVGGRASVSAPTAVNADGDAVRAWMLRTGAQTVALVASDGSTFLTQTSGDLDVNLARINGVALPSHLPIGDPTNPVEMLASGGDAQVNTLNELVVGSMGYLYNGATWDRVRGDLTNGMDVDVTRVQGTVQIGATDLDIRNLDVGQDDVRVAGMGPSGSAVVGDPVTVGGRASNAIPTDVGADGDAVWEWLNRHGAPIVSQAPHVGLNADPWTLTSKTARYTTTQTSAVLVAGAAGERIIVTSIQIQAGGTVAGEVVVYFGTGAYARGTNLAIFDGEFAPLGNVEAGVVLQGPFRSATNGDDILVTTSASINPLTIVVWYFVVT